MHTQIKERLEQVINNLKELPSIPDVAGKVISLVNNPDMSFKTVADEISKDQAITTNVLKLCNSAYFNRGKE
ncbi:MAG: HDOD domain-containing protein, partial [Spirochaetes bacterium]|nr:HDOD domain-containing protein [Spirochaetota bacterium]